MANKKIFKKYKKEHDHLKSLKCPRCGRRMNLIKNISHLVGCMEYEIFLCDRNPSIIPIPKNKINPNYDEPHNCKILIVNYPHDSANKDNKIIEI